MNPMQAMNELRELRHDAIFNKCRYEWEYELVHNMVNFYDGKMQWLASLDDDVKKLYEDIADKMQILRDRLQ